MDKDVKIKLLSRTEIDFDWWDEVISSCPWGKIYAYSWYLDIVTNRSWSALVSNDPIGIFPLPLKAIPVVGYPVAYRRPVFCQQLGLFGESQEILSHFEHFVNHIPRALLIDLPFHHLTPSHIKNIKTKTNLEIDLNQPYQEIYSNYHRSLKQRVNKSKRQLVHAESKDFSEITKMYVDMLQSRKKTNATLEKTLNDLLSECQVRNRLKCYRTFDKESNEFLGGMCLMMHHHRLVNLVSVCSDIGRKKNVMHGLFDHVFSTYAEKNWVFDFEGSEINGVYNFFKSFGSQDVPYFQYQDHTLIGGLLLKIKKYWR